MRQVICRSWLSSFLLCHCFVSREPWQPIYIILCSNALSLLKKNIIMCVHNQSMHTITWHLIKRGFMWPFSLVKHQLSSFLLSPVISGPYHQGRAGTVSFLCKVSGWFASWSAAPQTAVRPRPLQRSNLDTHPCQGAFTFLFSVTVCLSHAAKPRQSH